ncbi:MAG: hypothetical protein ACR2PI_01920 [Hyphomicrobiaceae bacterium]
MLVKLSILMGAVALLVSGTEPSLAKKKKRTRVAIANVASEVRTRIYYVYGANPDCSEKPPAIIRITKKPKHGLAEVAIVKGYSNYPKGHQRHPCNLTLRNIAAVYYKSNTGYTGRDNISLEWFTKGGGYGRKRYTINVR